MEKNVNECCRYWMLVQPLGTRQYTLLLLWKDVEGWSPLRLTRTELRGYVKLCALLEPPVSNCIFIFIHDFFLCVSVLLGWRGYYNCLVSVFLNLGHRCDCTSAGLLSSRSISSWICKGKSPSFWACGKMSVREPNTLNIWSHATCHRFFVGHNHNNHTH